MTTAVANAVKGRTSMKSDEFKYKTPDPKIPYLSKAMSYEQIVQWRLAQIVELLESLVKAFPEE